MTLNVECIPRDDVAHRRRRRRHNASRGMPAESRVRELRLAAASSAAAGNGRVELAPRAIRELGARLGDPVAVDVRLVDASGGGDDDAWTWTFLATVAPASVQQGTLASDAPSASDDAAVLDPSVRLPSSPGAPPPSARVDAGDGPLEARVRALDARPAPCVTLRVRAHDRDPTPAAAESLRRLLQHRVLAPGAAVHLARDDTPTASANPNRNANPSSPSPSPSPSPDDLALPIVVRGVEPPDATCVRVTPATRVVLVVDDDDHLPGASTPAPAASSADAVLAGADAVLDALREAIAWPIAHADDARALGARFPTGVLLHGPPGVGKTASVLAVAAEVGAAVRALSAGDVFGPYAGDSEARLRAAFRAAERDAARGTPAVLILDEIDAVCPARGADAGLHGSRVVAQLLTLMDDGGEEENVAEENAAEDGAERASAGKGETPRRSRRRIRPTVVATTNRPNALDPALRRPGRFDVEIEVPLPSPEQRAAILALHSRSLPLASDVDLAVVARDAKGYSGADLAGLCREAAMASIRRAAANETADGASSTTEMRVTARDFVDAASRVGASVVRGVAAELPPTTWDDVGGLEDAKRRLRQAVEWPMRHAEAFARLGLAPPRGILLHGPPGCAKTTMARAAATASGATTVTLAAADVFSKYVGEGERILRDAFARARRAAPAVLLLDEIDGMVGSRGAGEGDASDVGARILSVLLTEMDGLEPAGNEVLVVATTNRPEALDAALMRPGRLDLVLYVPPPDLEGRLAALRVHARDVPLAPDADLEDVARRTERFTGAELRGVVREAAMAALREDMNAAVVGRRHLEAALAAANPSLTDADLARWGSFRAR